MRKTVFTLFILGILFTVVFSCKKETCNTDVTYTNTMKSIIDTKCISCHKTGGSGAIHGTYTTYNDMKAHFDHAYEAVNEGEMPSSGAPQLTDEEIQQWKCWKENGFKE